MCKQQLIPFTAFLAGIFHLTLGLYIPESFSASATLSLTSLTPRQVGYTYCHTEQAGTCTIAYIINHKEALPLSIQILDNNCENGIGGKKYLLINATPDDIETDPIQTSPTTKFTVEYIADDKPARIKADGKEMFWRSADKGGKKIWTAPFDCHLRRGKSNT
ncbi:2ebb8c1f-0081-4c0b-971d-866e7703cfa9 [Sclerotinia trifoliorum]|uniref:2ebb8c1f-0081-4c0b-971d-866e7703cfa9 n=1 Tax=Sclerotinia trifoliorum TaxID=28548 RepID=A0A8H2W1I1_9HELO|nr:2ebb8c1f-0081-4c0b-971d-866e7703cfa9 [Sclerotinia trifoliorum]